MLAQYLKGQCAPITGDTLEAVQQVVSPVKEFLALSPQARMEAADDFCDNMARRIGELESRLSE